MTITSFQSPVWLAGRTLIRPLQAHLDVGDGEYVATHRESGIYGSGVSLVAAIDDLRAALTEHRDVLEDSPAPLAPLLAAQLRLLREHLGPRDPKETRE